MRRQSRRAGGDGGGRQRQGRWAGPAPVAAVALLLTAPAAGFSLYHPQQQQQQAARLAGRHASRPRAGAQAAGAAATSAAAAAAAAAAAGPLFAQTVDESERPMVRVRFINTPDGKDVVAVAKEGDNLMKVGDTAGLNIPRACRTGLCGACTSDLVDPSYSLKGESRPAGMREGHQTIRACSTNVKLPLGCEEMVVDVYRMKTKKGAKGGDGNPMERFSGDWEVDFRKGSKWDTNGAATGSNGMALRQARPEGGLICTTCSGTGKVTCFNCKGKGQLTMGQRASTCYICKGEGQFYCADCQATGVISRKNV